ncbi:transcriptional regulator [Succinimonas sp.]|uniref:helix-turn-helix transcriptional regulator n=1 Tax=Succinimonas sp. TaxID=1936151 RepID=UPI0038663849
MEDRRMSPDLLIHPGETISELLEERRITEMDLAMGLEYAFGISRSFWLNLQANYDAEYLKSL